MYFKCWPFFKKRFLCYFPFVPLLLWIGCARIPPLHSAADKGDIKKIDQLVAKGGSINERDEYGNTPLHHSVRAQKADAMVHLLSLGAEIDAKNLKNDTPLQIQSFF